MFNTDALSAIVSFVLFLGYVFLFDPARPYYGKTSSRYLNETKSSANYILLDNNDAFESALLSQETSTIAHRAIFIIPSQFPEGYARGLIETLNAHRERSVRTLSERTACTDR